MNQYINPAHMAKPSGFSHAVIAPAAGHTVYLAGQTALDADSTIVNVGDIVGQFRQSLSNLLSALDAAGGRPAHLVNLRIYLVDVPEYRRRAREIGAVWRELIGDTYPATAAIGVDRLWDDEALVEVEGVAVIPQ